MSPQKRIAKKKDPVVADQGGRMTQVDPKGSINVDKYEEVRRKAYEIYEQRGRTDGHDFDDWLSAESKV